MSQSSNVFVSTESLRFYSLAKLSNILKEKAKIVLEINWLIRG